MDLFSNKEQFDTGFSKRLKLKNICCADYFESNSNVAPHNLINCFYYMVTIALSNFTDRLSYLCILDLKQCPSMRNIFYISFIINYLKI